MVPQRFFAYGQRSIGDRHVYAQRTRFIPNSILEQFDNRSAGRLDASGGRHSSGRLYNRSSIQKEPTSFTTKVSIGRDRGPGCQI